MRGRELTATLEPVDFLMETPKARLVLYEGEEVWLPESQIVDYGDDWVEVTEWIAEQKGLL
ncbi:MAG: hypothetical protein ACYSUM_24275 [Planctomycetota bacterium]